MSQVTVASLVELGEKLPKSEVEARKFRAKLLGLIYEDLLEAWFKLNGYTILGKTIRKGLYKGKRTAVNFVLEKEGKLYAVESKCWPAYLEGRLKKLSLSNIEPVKRESKTPFYNEDFIKEYVYKGRNIDGKILVWWEYEEAELDKLKEALKVDQILSFKKILDELKGKVDDIVNKYKEFADQLFNALK